MYEKTWGPVDVLLKSASANLLTPKTGIPYLLTQNKNFHQCLKNQKPGQMIMVGHRTCSETLHEFLASSLSDRTTRPLIHTALPHNILY